MNNMQIKVPSRRTEFDVNFFKTLPGIFISIQLGCCGLGFLLGLFGPYGKLPGHIFFLIVMSMASSTSTFWILIHFCEAKNSYYLKNVNWNLAGIIYSGLNGFFAMVGSACMIDVACIDRALRAAGVFGFLGFTVFLLQFCWEMVRYLETALPPGAARQATITRGREKDPTPLSDSDCEDAIDPGVVGTVKPRPASTMVPMNQDVLTPQMSLLVDRQTNDRDDSDSFGSDISLDGNATNEYNLR